MNSLNTHTTLSAARLHAKLSAIKYKVPYYVVSHERGYEVISSLEAQHRNQCARWGLDPNDAGSSAAKALRDEALEGVRVLGELRDRAAPFLAPDPDRDHELLMQQS
mgnify:FL=1